jgi:chromosome segregation ATPase
MPFMQFVVMGCRSSSKTTFTKLLLLHLNKVLSKLKNKVMIRKLIFGLPLLGLLWSCDTQEKTRLRAQVDSLQTELQVSQQTAQSLEEVGSLIDSIDASRQLLRTDVVEGTSYKDYASRLRSINNHIKETQNKIAELEKSVKSSKSGYAATIKRMKADLSLSTQQIAALEQEVERMRGENQNLTASVNQKDSLLTTSAETIKMREQDVANLETKVEEINTQAKMTQADMYFAQAQALETAADRTKFAPRKKKETQREALELYKLSYSLGKSEAQNKIDELEKEVG